MGLGDLVLQTAATLLTASRKSLRLQTAEAAVVAFGFFFVAVATFLSWLPIPCRSNDIRFRNRFRVPPPQLIHSAPVIPRRI